MRAEESGAARRRSRARHAAEDEARQRDVSQAEGVRAGRSPARGAAAAERSRSRNLATTQYYGTGRRKTSTARVFLRPGKGTITVNRKPLETSFPTESLRLVIRQPLVADRNGRALRRAGDDGRRRRRRPGRRAAPRHRARARRVTTPSCAARLRKAGLLTRDPRAKERKKYGMAGARKRFQFSKR